MLGFKGHVLKEAIWGAEVSLRTIFLRNYSIEILFLPLRCCFFYIVILLLLYKYCCFDQYNYTVAYIEIQLLTFRYIA